MKFKVGDIVYNEKSKYYIKYICFVDELTYKYYYLDTHMDDNGPLNDIIYNLDNYNILITDAFREDEC